MRYADNPPSSTNARRTVWARLRIHGDALAARLGVSARIMRIAASPRGTEGQAAMDRAGGWSGGAARCGSTADKLRYLTRLAIYKL